MDYLLKGVASGSIFKLVFCEILDCSWWNFLVKTYIMECCFESQTGEK